MLRICLAISSAAMSPNKMSDPIFVLAHKRQRHLKYVSSKSMNATASTIGVHETATARYKFCICPIVGSFMVQTGGTPQAKQNMALALPPDMKELISITEDGATLEGLFMVKYGRTRSGFASGSLDHE